MIKMNDRQLEIFNSHNWGMRKIHNNVYGEPVYITICQNCDRLVSEVQGSWALCPKEINDKRSTGGVS